MNDPNETHSLNGKAQCYEDSFSQSRRRRFLFILELFLILFSAHPPARCQASPTTLSGQVFDPSGAVISGCQVAYLTLHGIPESHTITDHDGKFRLTLPATGGRMKVSCKGFAVIWRKVSRRPRMSSNLAFRARIASVKQTIQVTETPAHLSLDQADTQESEGITGKEIATLPVIDEDYLAFMSRFIDPSVIGARGVSLVVNGVEGGNFYQAPSAIKSLTINQNQYSPLYASPGRGRLSLITDSGTNHLHGSLDFALRQHIFDATPDFSPFKPAENQEDYQAVATGPIDRAGHFHFAISGQLKKNNQFYIVNAVTPAGPLVAAVPSPTYRDKVGGSLYFNNLHGKQWIIGIGRIDEVHHNGPFNGLYLPDITDFNEYTGHFIDLQRTDVLSPHSLNQVRLSLGQEGLLTRDKSSGPQINVAGAFVSGSEQGTQSYKQYVLAGNELFTTESANNTLQIGFDIPELSIHTDNNQTDRDGIYYYSSLAAYEAGKPDLFTITRGNGLVHFASLSAALFIQDTRQLDSRTTLMAGARYYFQNVYHNRPTHIAPRVELARSFGKQSNTVVRLGAGIFFDRLLTVDLAQLYQFDGRRLSQYIINDPPPMVTSISGIPPSYTQISPDSTIPYIGQWSAAVEHQITRQVVFSMQGTMNAGIHLLRMLDVNAPEPPAFDVFPNPELGQLLSSQSEGHSRSRSLDIMLKLSAFHGMTDQLRYRLAQSVDDTDGFSYIPANSYAPEQDASFASYDQRQNISLLSIWPAPHKWTLGTVLQAGSGLPYTELLGTDANRDGTANDRPAGVPRNSLRMAPQFTLDIRCGRKIALTTHEDGPTLSLSASAFNVANHPNYTSYQGVITSPDFGKPLTAAPPRQMQFNATFNF